MSYKSGLEPCEEVTFSCGHKERTGGTVADPAAIYAEREGRMAFREDAGLCTICRNPEQWKGVKW